MAMSAPLLLSLGLPDYRSIALLPASGLVILELPPSQPAQQSVPIPTSPAIASHPIPITQISFPHSPSHIPSFSSIMQPSPTRLYPLPCTCHLHFPMCHRHSMPPCRATTSFPFPPMMAKMTLWAGSIAATNSFTRSVPRHRESLDVLLPPHWHSPAVVLHPQTRCW